MKKVTVAALAAVALVAMPVAGADAGKGKLRSESKAQHRSDKGDSGGERAGKRELRKCKRQRRVGFVAAGTASAQDSASFVLTVRRANRHAKKWLAVNEATFSTTGVKLRLKGIDDSTGDGTVDFADVLSTDRVRVIGKLSRPKRRCTGDATLRLRRIVVHRKFDAKETELDEAEADETELDEAEVDETELDETEVGPVEDNPTEEEPAE